MWVYVNYAYLFLQFASVTRERAGIYCLRFISQNIFHQVNHRATNQRWFSNYEFCISSDIDVKIRLIFYTIFKYNLNINSNIDCVYILILYNFIWVSFKCLHKNLLFEHKACEKISSQCRMCLSRSVDRHWVFCSPINVTDSGLCSE